MAKNKKKISGQDLTVKIVLAVTAIVIIGCLCGLIISGPLFRIVSPLASDNFKVSGPMMKYYYQSTYLNLVSQMGDYLSYTGLDTSKPLDKQSFMGSEQTWHDYLIETSTAQTKQTLVLAEAAKAAGMTITEEDEATIKENFDAMQQAATQYGYPTLNSFIAAQYGEGLKEKDVRRALELTILASKYSEKIADEIVITDDEINTFFTENEKNYTYVSLRQTTFSATNALNIEGLTDAEKADIIAGYKKSAEELAATKSVEEFELYMTDYMKQNVAEGGTGEITEENIASNLEATKYPNYTSRDTEQGKWAFAEERKVGDTTIIENEAGTEFTVCMIEETKTRSEDLSRNVRHILFLASEHTDAAGAKAAAEEVLAKWNAGEKTEEAFAALAREYSEDPGSAKEGGLYENVLPGEMVSEFDGWLYAEERKAGDVEIVESADYGAHIMFYVGEGQPEWEITVRSDITEKKYSEAYDALASATEIKESKFAMGLVG